jgi:hypothetical protein
MSSKKCVAVFVGILGWLCVFPTWSAEVSLTIQGNADEIMAILQLLRDSGFVSATAPDPLRLHVHSVAGPTDAQAAPQEGSVESGAGSTTAEAPATEAPAAAPTPPPTPALMNVIIEPQVSKAGQPVRLMVTVQDPNHEIDTLAAEIDGTGVSVDLFDNGMNGDAVVGDGIWSGTALLPSDLRAGDYTVSFQAFDGKGNAIEVTGADGAKHPLRLEGKLTLLP